MVPVLVLICISLTANDVEQVFLCVVSSLKKWLFRILVHFLIGLLVFLLLSFSNSLCTWIQIPYRCMICKYFFLILSFSVYFLYIFVCTKVFHFDEVWFYFLLLLVLSVSYLRLLYLIQSHKDLLLCFLLRFLILALTVRSVILSLGHDIRKESTVLCMWLSSCIDIFFFERTILPLHCLHVLVKNELIISVFISRFSMDSINLYVYPHASTTLSGLL